jgi:hypothetical protein
LDIGLYPDVHKRGLRVVFADAWGVSAAAAAPEPSLPDLINTLLTAGIEFV